VPRETKKRECVTGARRRRRDLWTSKKDNLPAFEEEYVFAFALLLESGD
jgi:hypothetical protein